MKYHVKMTIGSCDVESDMLPRVEDGHLVIGSAALFAPGEWSSVLEVPAEPSELHIVAESIELHGATITGASKVEAKGVVTHPRATMKGGMDMTVSLAEKAS